MLSFRWLHSLFPNCSAPADQGVSRQVHASAGRWLQPLIAISLLAGGLSPSSLAGIITGRAFVDYNGNGAIDTTEYGVTGIVVTAYDEDGLNVGSATTGFTGVYSVNATGSGPYRVEFSQIPTHLHPGYQGASGGSSIRFLNAASASNFNLPLIDPLRFNTQANPDTVTTQFAFGPFDGSFSARSALTRVPYAASGHHFSGTTPTAAFQAKAVAEFGQIGATYGIAHQSTHDRLYVGAYHKRFSGFGPQGPDAIYVLDGSTHAIVGVIKLDHLTNQAGSAGADVHNFTPQDGQIYDIGSNANANSESFDGVGKRALGDIDLSADMKTLYVVNLFDRSIYAIDVSSGIPEEATLLHVWASPDATGAARHRPFALGLHEGKVWVGSVDENGSNAFIHSFVPVGANPAFTLEVTLPLNYPRQAFIGQANNPARLSNWRAWATNAATVTPMSTNADEIGWPQPILADIEFDGKNMILGLRDRFGDQAGYAKRFNLAATRPSYPISAGDLLLVCRTANGWAIEGTAACPTSGGMTQSGPGGAIYPEHYEWDLFSDGVTWDVMSTAGGLQWETTQGGLLQLAGKSTLLTTSMNPFSDFSGGVVRFENSTGRREGILGNSSPPPPSGGYTLYEGGEYGVDFPADIGYFNEANGLGDIAALLTPAPIQIGNRVWSDLNGNGIQDADEPGIGNVGLVLYDAEGTLVATTTSATSADSDLLGTYQFDDLSPDTAYVLVIDPAAFAAGGPLHGQKRTQTGTGTPLTDSDGVILSDLSGALTPLNGQVGYSFVTGPIGSSNHSLDFGFEGCPVIALSPPSLPNGVVGSPYTHTITAGGSGATAPFLFQLTTGELPPELALATDGELAGIPYTSGSTTFTVQATDAEGCRGSQSFSLYICPVLEIVPTFANAQRLTPYHQVITVLGGTGPYLFTIIDGSLPDGLSIVDGVITGTPTGGPGQSDFTLSATDSLGCNVVIETSITTTCNVLSLSPALLPPGNLFTPYPAQSFSASGGFGSLTWQLTGTLPTGLTFDAPTATLSGTPTQAGSFEFTLTAHDAHGCLGTLNLQLDITTVPTWTAWQFQNALNGQNHPLDNPDGDHFDNLQEFAFGFPADSGVKTTCPLQIVTDPATGRVDARLLRVTGIVGVSYQLQAIATLDASPAGWTDVTTLTPTITFNPDGTEWATFADLTTLPGLSSSGFFRVKIELDSDQNGTPEATTFTDVSGFFRRLHSQHIESFSNPFLRCDGFSGTIDAITGTTLHVATSVGTGDLTSVFDGTSQYYLEITQGVQSGQRLEIDEAACTATSIAVDLSHPLSTLPSLPGDLAGQALVIRPHHTLDSLFHKPHLNATNNQATAARVLVYLGNAFRSYWLFRNGGNPMWVLDSDFTLANAGSRVVAPQEALLFHPRSDSIYLTYSGIVRANDFALPLQTGINFKATGWPMELSPVQAGMTTARGFTGSNTAANSDRLLFWNGDATSAATGFNGHFLLVAGPFNFWTTEKDASLIDENHFPLFSPLRGFIIRSKNGHPTYVQPCPWTP